ncbi:MAG: helix-turn-helix transcriptional regulator [Flavobacteriales bacterium]|nr:helix-turn-helix transcriptional regulator [Flavobacteriales bacterium]
MMIGTRIKTRRKFLGLTQVELAQRANVSESVICRIELGVRLPDMALVQRLAAALETTVAYLLDGTDPGNASNGNHAERAKQLEQRVEQLEEEVSGGRRMISFLQGVIDRLLPGSRGGED